MTREACSVQYGDVPDEFDENSGNLTWQTLISGDRMASGEIVLGVADFPPHGDLKPHFHRPAEFYFGLAGSGRVRAGDKVFVVKKDVAVFIPGNTEHTVQAGPDGLRILYGFARDDFDSIEYTFTGSDPNFSAQ